MVASDVHRGRRHLAEVLDDDAVSFGVCVRIYSDADVYRELRVVALLAISSIFVSHCLPLTTVK